MIPIDEKKVGVIPLEDYGFNIIQIRWRYIRFLQQLCIHKIWYGEHVRKGNELSPQQAAGYHVGFVTLCR